MTSPEFEEYFPPRGLETQKRGRKKLSTTKEICDNNALGQSALIRPREFVFISDKQLSDEELSSRTTSFLGQKLIQYSGAEEMGKP
jgi:hypothetical protein